MLPLARYIFAESVISECKTTLLFNGILFVIIALNTICQLKSIYDLVAHSLMLHIPDEIWDLIIIKMITEFMMRISKIESNICNCRRHWRPSQAILFLIDNNLTPSVQLYLDLQTYFLWHFQRHNVRIEKCIFMNQENILCMNQSIYYNYSKAFRKLHFYYDQKRNFKTFFCFRCYL